MRGMLEMSPRHWTPSTLFPKGLPWLAPSSGPQAPGDSNPVQDAEKCSVGDVAGSACPSWCQGGDMHPLTHTLSTGTRETLQPTSPPALWEDGISEGNLPLPFKRVLHKEILDSDQENSLIPPSGRAPRPLPAHPDKLLTSCCRQLSCAARRQHQNTVQAALERVITHSGRNGE